MNTPILHEEFSNLLKQCFGDAFANQDAVAIGVSGGPDSLALLKLLSAWSDAEGGPAIHALIVDHGLREESAQQSSDIQTLSQKWPKVESTILTWGAPSKNRIQEDARNARYDLMAQHCRAHNITYLFLGHHQDDQSETFLFRLAKGSGLNGLGGMKPRQDMKGITLLRPFLDIPKGRLLATCEADDLKFINDPSNKNDGFARVRLRGSMDVLAKEGLTPKRLSKTAQRLARASDALDNVTRNVIQEACVDRDDANNISILNSTVLIAAHEEIVVRAVLWFFDHFDVHNKNGYAPRMEKVEALAYDLVHTEAFRKRTLGGLVFERDDERDYIIVTLENGRKH